MKTLVSLVIAVAVILALGAAFGAGHGDTIFRVRDYFGYFAIGLFGLLVLAWLAVALKKIGSFLGLSGSHRD